MVDVIDWTTEEVARSERRFLEAAERNLPDNWTVIHGLRIKAGRPLRDHEVDFVVIDPRRGVLIIEVKGGGIEREGNDWVSINRKGKRNEIRNPVEQANECRWAIRKRLRDSLPYRGHRVPVMGSAVAFPDVVLNTVDLGADLPVDIVIDSGDLKDLKTALSRIFDAHPRATMTLSAIKAFCAALRPPRYSLPESLAARLDADRDALDRLTEEQASVLAYLENQPRAAIEGAAGTGKTVLAEMKAAQLAGQGARVLFLCFNQGLAESLAQSARDQQFQAKSFHSFCAGCAEKAGLEFSPPEHEQDKQEFWDKRAPSILMDALESLPEYRFDAIVVDEAQDFKEDWWAVIDCVLRGGKDRVLYAFYDPEQQIYGGGPSEALEVLPVPLKRNCRNTRRIAEHAASLVGIDYEFGPGAKPGLDVESIDYDTPEEMADQVRRQLHRLVREKGIATERVTVLTTRRLERSDLDEKRRLGNFRLMRRPARSQDVRFTSLHAFKGLESDVVILTEVDWNPKSCTNRHLYVAATRARTLLIQLQQARAA